MQGDRSPCGFIARYRVNEELWDDDVELEEDVPVPELIKKYYMNGAWPDHPDLTWPEVKEELEYLDRTSDPFKDMSPYMTKSPLLEYLSFLSHTTLGDCISVTEDTSLMNLLEVDMTDLSEGIVSGLRKVLEEMTDESEGSIKDLNLTDLISKVLLEELARPPVQLFRIAAELVGCGPYTARSHHEAYLVYLGVSVRTSVGLLEFISDAKREPRLIRTLKN